MRWLHVVRHGVRTLIARRAVDAQIDDDLAFHLEQATAEYERAGLPPDDARRAALKAFGDPVYVKDDVHEVSAWIWLERLAQDLRYSLRGFRRTPVFVTAALLSIALGIGVNTAIFSLFNALVHVPLPVRDPASLYQVVHRGDAGSFESSTYALYAQLKSRSDLISGILQVDPSYSRRVMVDGQASPAVTQRVTGNYHGMLGVQPAFGTLIQPVDEPGAAPNRVAVLGHAFWMERFGGDRRVLGRTIVIEDVAYTIIGVTGPEFFGLQVGRRADVTVPIDGSDEPAFWKSRALVVRLAPGISREAAAAGLNGSFQQYLAASAPIPERTRAGAFRSLDLVSSWSGLPELRDRYGTALQVALGIVGVVLTLGCANLASLFLARAAGRQRDLAVCLALGAHRGRLARQAIVETFLIAVTGGALGIALAVWGIEAILKLLPDAATSHLQVSIDRRVLVFGGAVTLLAGLAIGLAPVVLTRRVDLRDALCAGGRSIAIGARAFRSLVVAQVALSTMLVVAATLLVATLDNLRRQPLGFEADGVLTITASADGTGLEGEPLGQLQLQMLERLQALPGVGHASFATNPPLGSNEDGKPISIPGMTFASPEDGVLQVNVVGPGFFQAFGVGILRGRGITATDTASSPQVVVVSESMARYYFPGQDPVGRRMDIGRGRTDGQIEIVGIAADVRYRDLRTPAPRMLYVPAQQREAEPTTVFAIRTEGNPGPWAQPARDALRAVAPAMLFTDVKTLSSLRDERLVNERLLAFLSASFGALALLLASVGVYGIVAYSVAMRTHELGLRMALGANRLRIVWLVLRGSLTLSIVAVTIGAAAAFLASSWLAGMLFEVRPAEPWVYSMAMLLLIGTALLAAVGPTLRALRIAPGDTLRGL